MPTQKRYVYLPIIAVVVLATVSIVVFQSMLNSETREIQVLTTRRSEALIQQIKQGIDNRMFSFERMARRLDFRRSFDREAWAADAAVYRRDLRGLEVIFVTDKSDRLIAASTDYKTDPEKMRVQDPDIWDKGLAEARRTKRPSTQLLVVEKLKSPMMFVVIPLFGGGPYSGSLVMISRLEEIFGEVLRDNEYHLEIQREGRRLFANRPGILQGPPAWLVSQPLNIGGERFELRLMPTSETATGNRTGLPLILLFAGLTVAILFGTSIYLAVGLRERNKVIAEQHSFLKTMIDNLPYAVFCRDFTKEGHFLLWNKKAEELFGLSAEDVLSRTDLKQFNPEYQKVFATGDYDRTTHRESEITDPKGGRDKLILHTSKTTVLGENGEPQYMIGISEDITADRADELALLDSEQRFMSFMENSTAMTWIKDAEGRFNYINHRVTELFGLPREKIIGRKSVSGADSEATRASHAEDEIVMRTGTRRTVTQRILLPDGRATFWSVMKFPVQHSSGVMMGAMAVDVTERVEAEQALEKNRNTLQAIIDSSPSAIMTHDLDGKVTGWSPACEELFGWTAAEVLGKEIPFVPAHKRAESKRIIANIILHGKDGFSTETERQRKDGTTVHVGMESRVLLAENDQDPIGCISIMTDIGERKLAERKLQEAKEQAEKAARLKSDFLANVSHEIRTPMNGILGMTDLILQTELTEEQRRYAEIVQSSGGILLALINDVLDLSKIEAGKMNLEDTEFSLVNLVEGHANLLIAKAREKGLSLMTYVDPSLPVQVGGDSSRIGQVLVNLIGNAIKFTEKGGVTVRVTPRTAYEAGDSFAEVRIEVRDTGIGLTPEAKNRLFQPFVQGESSTTRKYGGTGLGLSISKKLVEAMGGEIGVESAPGEGSTFWFTLRLRSESCETNAANGPLRLRVLVLESDPIARQVIGDYLHSWNFEMLIPAPGVTAAEVLREQQGLGRKVEVALIGQAPDVDAFQLARGLEAEFGGSAPKMILMTPFEVRVSETELRQSALAAAISKPLRKSQLFDSLVMSAADIKNAAPVPAAPAVPAAGAKKRAGRVLVVDDVSVNRILALKLVENLGYSGQAVANGAEAVKTLEEVGSFDLVLMDCQMPEMDGFEATRLIRASAVPGVAETVIIALTANAMSEDRQKCLEAGMNDYLAKPIDKNKLAGILDTWSKKFRTNAA